MIELAANIERVFEGVAAAARRAGRDASEILVVAVSKGFPAEAIHRAEGLGIRDFGENRTADLVAKAEQLGEDVRWHFVGRLQRNKVREVVGLTRIIHSVDRAELAVEIGSRASSPQSILIQVNVAGREGMGGVAVHGLLPLVQAAVETPNVRVEGLMAMAPMGGEPDHARPYFRRLARAADRCRAEFPEAGIHHLSMGMSQDYEVAIEEGATMVRIGEAIFGPRRRC